MRIWSHSSRALRGELGMCQDASRMDTEPGSSPRSWLGVRVSGQASPKIESEERLRAEPARERKEVRGESNARASILLASGGGYWVSGGCEADRCVWV